MTVQIRLPYVVFLGDIHDRTLAKTGFGLVQWCGDQVVGQLRLPGCAVDLGIAELSLQQAIQQGAQSIVIGVATVGGTIQADWLPTLTAALRAGLDIVNGLHTDLTQIPVLAEAQRSSTGQIINVRKAPPGIGIGSGRKRTGMRLLTVGTDCAVGKKYTALALTQTLQQQGFKATFRATGQTGIMIAGEGIPMDSVVSDFLGGAAELLSPDHDADHWDIIEGQGSLFNPSFSAVSMGLLHGSQPDAIIVCHDAGRQVMSTCPSYVLPTIADCIALHLSCARLVNPRVRCIGVSVNTSSLPLSDRVDYLRALEAEIGLPCIDPLIDGCDAFVEQLQHGAPPLSFAGTHG
jgi:uncharacterized NAD-dependent epimerase/dehydratase family protein